MAQLEDTVTRLSNATLNAHKDFDARLSALTDAQMRTEAALAKVAEAQERRAESQAHTDKRLDALIDTVREDRNGRS